jgi:hypothetical protein
MTKPPPKRIDPEIMSNCEDPRAAEKDREVARQILRDQEGGHEQR